MRLPGRQQLCGRLPTIGEREGRRRVERGRRVGEWEIGKPDRGAILQRDPCIGPVRLVARDAVTRVAHGQRELARPPKRDTHGLRRHALADHGRAEGLAAADADREDDAPPAADGLLVRVEPNVGSEGPAGTRQADNDAAIGVAEEPVCVGPAAELERLAEPGVLLYRVVVLEHLKPGRRRRRTGVLKLRGDPRAASRHLVRSHGDTVAPWSIRHRHEHPQSYCQPTHQHVHPTKDCVRGRCLR